LKAQVQVESSLSMIKFEEIFKLAEQKLKEKYLAVEKNLIQHERKLHNIEGEMSRLVTYNRGFTQGSSRTFNHADTSVENINEDPESLLRNNLLTLSRINQEK